MRALHIDARIVISFVREKTAYTRSVVNASLSYSYYSSLVNEIFALEERAQMEDLPDTQA